MGINNAFPDLNRNLEFFPLGVDEPVILNNKDINFFNKFGFLFPIRIFNTLESKKIKNISMTYCKRLLNLDGIAMKYIIDISIVKGFLKL